MNRAAILLTNFLRPENLVKQLALLQSVRETFDILLIDNANRGSNLRTRIPIENWYTYIENGMNLGAGYRFLISCSLPYEVIIAVDDDVFLTNDQISLIYHAVSREPTRVHGVWGQVLDHGSGRRRLKGNVSTETRPVHVISRVYGYTPETAFRSLLLAKEIGFNSWRDIGPTDDILLSAASLKAPLCHGVDHLSVCETSDTEGIATWKTEGFYPTRNNLVDKLLKAGLFPTEKP